MSILPAQIEFEPKVVGEAPRKSRVVIGGMGGSALAGRVLQDLYPGRIALHLDYNLPTPAPEDALYIALSYSGNTEETLSFFDEALTRGAPIAVITSGGALLERAKKTGTPYIVVPVLGEPRDQLLILIKSILALMKEHSGEWNTYPHVEKEVGDEAHRVSKAISGRAPIIYSSNRNEALAYIAKITMNETGKTPAFSNVFPEMNHNEIQGLEHLPRHFLPLLIRDNTDHERIVRRMDVFKEVMNRQGTEVVEVSLPKGTRIHSILYAWLLFREVGHLLALQKGIEPDKTPLIAEFKNLL